MVRFHYGVSLAATLALCSVASLASAQDSDFARSGVLAFGVDRLFGITRTSVTASEGDADATTSVTEISLLSSGGGVSPYAMPRLSLDGFAADNISIGGHIGVVHQSTDSDTDTPAGETSADGPSGTAFLVGARVGYA